MLIFLKLSIKTIVLLLLFTTVGLNLMAANPLLLEKGYANKINSVNTKGPDYFKTADCKLYTSNDSLQRELRNLALPETLKNEIFIIPAHLIRLPIDFRINSSIRYCSFDHFVSNEAKKLFFYAFLKDKELKQISALTDSLRKSYSMASLDQKETIAAKILKSEEKSIALNQEIPALYQKAREEEDQYWQTVSQLSIIRFQEKISLYKDSVSQISGEKIEQNAPINREIPDTITLYRSTPARVQNPAIAAASGITYRIQIGAYKGKIPVTANKQIKKISILRKVENHVDERGVKVFTTGNLRLYPEAATMLGQVKQEGIKNAIIAAYQNGQPISINEARKLNNEL